jgi:hypothetical protein
MTDRNNSYIFNYAFIISLVLLALNDHVFKGLYGNVVTGKLSDVAGLVVLPLFLAWFFPKLKNSAVAFGILLFILWKLPISQPFINTVNNTFNLHLGRVVDYTDLFCLLILPLPYFIIKDNEVLHFLKMANSRLHPAVLAMPCALVLTATSMPRGYLESYRPETGNIQFSGVYFDVKHSPAEVLSILKKEGLKPTLDTVGMPTRIHDKEVYESQQKHGLLKESLSYDDWKKIRTTQWRDTLEGEFRTSRKHFTNMYVIKEFISGNDTLQNLKFYIYSYYNDKQRSSISLYGLNAGKDLSDEQVKKKLTRTYKRAIKRYFKNLDKK